MSAHPDPADCTRGFDNAPCPACRAALADERDRRDARLLVAEASEGTLVDALHWLAEQGHARTVAEALRAVD